jgi:nucleoside-diphosphate-sugar epimerase
MRVLVTGATGVIGRRVVRLLIAEGHRVTAVARTPQKRGQLAGTGAIPIDLDLFAGDAVRRAVAGHDAVVNLATHLPTGFGAFLPGAWATNHRIRRVASNLLVDGAIAAGAQVFVQESFAPVYPSRGGDWIDETTPIAPVQYNRTVADAEAATARFASGGGTGVVLRFAMLYGPDAWQTRETIRMIRRGLALMPGAPDAFVSSVSHDDAAGAVLAALDVPTGAYNVVDDEPLRRREYFDSLAKLLGVGPPRIPPGWIARMLGSVGTMLARSLRISNRKLRTQSGWRPRFPSMREGWRAVLAADPMD